MWKKHAASIKEDPVNPALVECTQNEKSKKQCVCRCVCVGVCVCQKSLASIVTSLGRNEGWTCPHH